MTNDQHVLSAQIIIRSINGDKIEPDTVLTSENIHNFTPSTESINNATTFFKEKGFLVGNFVGISFSITGPTELFEAVMKVKVKIEANKRGTFIRNDGSETATLEGDALTHLPHGLVESIAFAEPPEFGPESFF
ncbi:MAG: hypothetical protein GY702_15830 [Desulfobulbaceae bacterium]|nr:hypothetical protein [Desulfobulbaceae bacterium]